MNVLFRSIGLASFSWAASCWGCTMQLDGDSVDPLDITLSGAAPQASTGVRFYASTVAAPANPPPGTGWVTVANGTSGTTSAFQTRGMDWYLYFASTPNIPSNAWFPCAEREIVSQSNIPLGRTQSAGRCVTIAGIVDMNLSGTFTHYGDDLPVAVWATQPSNDPDDDDRPCLEYTLSPMSPPFEGDSTISDMVHCFAPEQTAGTSSGESYQHLVLVAECGHAGQPCCPSEVGSACNPSFNCGMGGTICCAPGYMGMDNTCNGMDEDCDSSVDEGYAPTADTTCNGVDEDCDGDVDEGYSPTANTDCDGIDDDCDGHVDEDWTSTSCEGATTAFNDNCQEDFNPPGRTYCDDGVETCEAVSTSVGEDVGTYCTGCGGPCGLCSPGAPEVCTLWGGVCPPNRNCVEFGGHAASQCYPIVGCPHIDVPTCWLPEWVGTCVDGTTD